MVVLVIVVVACFIAGVWAATKWLPPLAEGPVGSLVYFVVCGLTGAVLVIFGVRIWEIVRELEEARRFLDTPQLVAGALLSLLYQCATIMALTLVVYLLAPKAKSPASN
jgi:hypothetical protein